MSASRREAIFALTLWRTRGVYPALTLKTAQERAFASELTGATLRHLSAIEWVIAQCVKRLPSGDLRQALCVGVAQLLYLPGVPEYAAIAETVNAVKPIGKDAARFVNAVLRRIQREKATLLSALERQPEPIRRNVPPALWTRWVAHFGHERAVALAEAMAEPALVAIRPLPPFGAPATCSPHPDDPQGSFIVPGGVRVESLPGFAEGHFVVQDPATRHAVELLDVHPGQRVLDACAAPGGKTAQIASRLFASGDRSGRLTANEASKARLPLLEDTIRRCAPSLPIEITARDATALPETVTFDRILLDVPCSNTGVFGRRADARWTWSERKMSALCQTQAELLTSCALRLAPGGRLVYSTCSLEPEENERQVEHFLSTHPDFEQVDSRRVFPEGGHDGAFASALTRHP